MTAGTKKQRSRGTLLAQCALALIGLGVFVQLIRSSGVSMAMLRRFGAANLGLLLLVSLLVIVVDTIAWKLALSASTRAGFWPLFGLRIAGDALSNGLPGGVVLGESYKALKIKHRYGTGIAENALALVLVKFGLGLSQSVFVLIGIALAYPLLAARSKALFGFEGVQYVALCLAAGMGLFLAIPLSTLKKPGAVASLMMAVARLPIPPLSSAIRAREQAIRTADEHCVLVFRKHRKSLGLVFFWLFLGWVISVAESYIVLSALGLHPTPAVAWCVESLGSLFRLVFFMVPSGIGGQDASFLALFSLYGFPAEAGGLFVLVKRFKELLWIGLGFALAPLLARASFAARKPEKEDVSLPELRN